MNSASAPSLKFTMAADACACTLGLEKSSIVAMRAGTMRACAFSWMVGPRSVHIWPSAWQAPHRTLGDESVRPLMHMSTRMSTWASMTFWQPSAICARQTSAPWRLRQSGSASQAGSNDPADGTMALPPNEMATRSRHSCAKLYSSPAPSSSYLSSSAWCHRGSSSTSNRNSMSVSNNEGVKLGSLRIIPGALSRASHRVTKNSAASERVAASSASARAMDSIAPTTPFKDLRKNRGCASATSMSISSASCALLSSPALRVVPKQASMGSSRPWNLSRSEGSSIAWMNSEEARSAASCTSRTAWDKHTPRPVTRAGSCGLKASGMHCDSRPSTSSPDSMSVGCPDCTHWNMKGMSSGHCVAPGASSSASSAPSSATVSQILRTTVFCCSSWTALSSSTLMLPCMLGEMLPQMF
mmetsp:Transcript_22053/g.61059  ORF Transcript_22053/g.61059 Transcript_22053/m.61059 type:complete len:413 (-) Transcript_22053:359-1597(-)